ncbi:MAG: sensor domain-containing diguanylate cyclase [Pseudomonadota bacterium]|nr:sensor domain-containing diguanylate cyclase [Pseudomonadota bacterium]
MENNTFRDIFMSSLDALLIIEANSGGLILDANPATTRILGYGPEDLIGKQFSVLFPKDRGVAAGDVLERIQVYESTFIQEFQDASGSECRLELSVTMIPWRGENAIIATLRDSSARIAEEEKLRELASVDALTKVFNRRQFMTSLHSALSSAQRHQFPLSLCICDIDNFKKINDVHGHLSGDQVLISLARLLESESRLEDAVGRFGGDEFSVLFPYASTKDAFSIVERVRMHLEANVFQTAEGGSFNVTASFGVADFEGCEDNLFECADKALLAAKKAGRNRIVVYTGEGDAG